MWPFKKRKRDERNFYPWATYADTRAEWEKRADAWMPVGAMVFVIGEGLYVAHKDMTVGELLQSDQFMPIAEPKKKYLRD